MIDDTAEEGPPSNDNAELVTLQIQLRPAHLRRLQALAAREGATPEAFAALLIEEQLDQAQGGAAGKTT